jgi:uncharacterized protein YdiU (UPF0061 family)
MRWFSLCKHTVTPITDAINEDFTLFETMVRVLAKPFDDQEGYAQLATPPLPAERVSQTFCGT